MRTCTALFFSILLSSCVAGDPEGIPHSESLPDGFYEATVVLNDGELNVTLELKDSRFFYGSDMEIPLQNIKAIDTSYPGETSAPSLNFNYVVNRNQLWPGGVLPYEFDSDLASSKRAVFFKSY